ncbi:hypothetical protein [Streptomyces sp. NPDC051684]|uniref:hypothetical protein n=1 Tax=Streptomyces sp. NPDC051684 TaxID=3365670 RepID=UPI003797D181
MPGTFAEVLAFDQSIPSLAQVYGDDGHYQETVRDTMAVQLGTEQTPAPAS